MIAQITIDDAYAYIELAVIAELLTRTDKLTLLTPGGGRKGPGLQFRLNHGHRGARREPKLFCKFIFCSW